MASGGKRAGAGRKPKIEPSKMTLKHAQNLAESQALVRLGGVQQGGIYENCYPPCRLGNVAGDLWRECMPVIRGRDSFKPSDFILLAVCCATTENVATAQTVLNDEGLTQSRDIGLMKHSAASVQSEQRALSEKLKQLLGLGSIAYEKLHNAQLVTRNMERAMAKRNERAQLEWYEERLREHTPEQVQESDKIAMVMNLVTGQVWEGCKPPILLNKEAMVLWELCIPEVAGRDSFDQSDLIGLAEYCLVTASVMEAQLQIEEEGLTQSRKNGQMKHPAVVVQCAQIATMVRLSNQLGLNPMAFETMRQLQLDNAESLCLVEQAEKRDAVFFQKAKDGIEAKAKKRKEAEREAGESPSHPT